eukprot:scaffold116425_cov41-Phaeocystis_antarctica.AAC.1
MIFSCFFALAACSKGGDARERAAPGRNVRPEQAEEGDASGVGGRRRQAGPRSRGSAGARQGQCRWQAR